MLHVRAAVAAAKAAAGVANQRRRTTRISSQISRKSESILLAKHQQQRRTVHLCIRRMRAARRRNGCSEVNITRTSKLLFSITKSKVRHHSNCDARFLFLYFSMKVCLSMHNPWPEFNCSSDSERSVFHADHQNIETHR